VIAALALALVAGVPQGARENRLHLAHVELIGPLAEATFDLGAMGETRVVGPLAEGERRTALIPLPAWGDPRGAQPEVELDGEGHARFVEWDERGNDELARRWLALPAGLRARPLPVPPAVDRRRPPEVAVLVVAALFLVGLALRKRPRAGHALGFLGALGVGVLSAPVGAPPAGVVVHEGAEGGHWLAVQVARASFETEYDEGTLRVEVLPPRARVRWCVTLGREREWAASAPGTVFFGLGASRFDGPLRTARNDLDGLDEVWVREAGASGWVEHPPWVRGEGLRLPRGPADPPGWLNPALPMGSGALIARVRPAPFREESDWIRLVGLSPPCPA
jgi:hypothetical protein